MGVPKDRIELWHHLVDGVNETFMDWECTEDYCRKFAEAFGVPIYFSWKEGGFKKEMLRDETATAETWFEIPEEEYDATSNTNYHVGAENGLRETGKPYYVRRTGGKGKAGTRLKFPQVSADLNTRWCSAYLKIDVCSAAIRNQKRFLNKWTALISGERSEESKARSRYAEEEMDRTHLQKRGVTRLRLIKNWTEQQVWEIIEKYKVVVHPCYYMGWGRCSCKFCIFGNANQFASAFSISPKIGVEIIQYEIQFNTTIKRNKSVKDLVGEGIAYQSISNIMRLIATSKKYTENIFTDKWLLPAGAYGDNCGPT